MSVQLRNFLLRERGRENKRNELRGVIQRRLTRILFFFFSKSRWESIERARVIFLRVENIEKRREKTGRRVAKDQP